jgi:hypothetical protein
MECVLLGMNVSSYRRFYSEEPSLKLNFKSKKEIKLRFHKIFQFFISTCIWRL